MTEHHVIFDHFIHQQPVSWKRQGGAGKFRWRDKKQMDKAKDTLAWEIKVAEPRLRCDAHSRFGFRARFHLFTHADGDNLEKLLMDALAGIVWENDGQCDEGSWTKKIVHKHAGIQLLIYRIEEKQTLHSG